MRTPIASSYEAITVSSTAIGLTPPTNADSAFISIETDAIRYTVDGTTPTAAIGHPKAAATELNLESKKELTAFQAIRVTNDASLKVTYFMGVRRP